MNRALNRSQGMRCVRKFDRAKNNDNYTVTCPRREILDILKKFILETVQHARNVTFERFNHWPFR